MSILERWLPYTVSVHLGHTDTIWKVSSNVFCHPWQTEVSTLQDQYHPLLGQQMPLQGEPLDHLLGFGSQRSSWETISFLLLQQWPLNYQKILGRTCALISSAACFRFPIYLSVIFPGTFLQTNVSKIQKSGSRSSSACNALNFFSVESLAVKL